MSEWHAYESQLSAAVLHLWGKTVKGDRNRYHPLLFHLLDVAFCSLHMWEATPVGTRTMLQRSIPAMEDPAAGIALLAGLHDIGKAYPAFQFQPTPLESLRAALLDLGFDRPPDVPIWPHNYVSSVEIKRLLSDGSIFGAGDDRDFTNRIQFVLGAHHGTFPQAEDLTGIGGRGLGESPTWLSARNSLAEFVKRSVPECAITSPAIPGSTTESVIAAVLLAAWISIADWFGSSRAFIGAEVANADRYKGRSEALAKDLLTRSGWTPPLAPPPAAEFQQVFAYLMPGKVVGPRALQELVLETLPTVSGPALWLIEEEMGAGKTEAALTILDHARAELACPGTYIAMPTQATSNAMFTRLGDYLRHRDKGQVINMVLAHSHSILDAEYRERLKLAEEYIEPVYMDGTAEADAVLMVQSWFTGSKQTLLAHFGVGTIDQALLGVLQVRHWFVRLFGLRGKVVVFDEVHAYDAYMNALLRKLIQWLAALDCTVILLSATLPRKARLEIAEAYCSGARAELEEPPNLVHYPRLTTVLRENPRSARAQTVIDFDRECKRVEFTCGPSSSRTIRDHLLAAIPGEGCAILVCNTVARAQHLYNEMCEELRDLDWRILLFHARTPFVWRKEREDEVLDLFGKESGEKRTVPRRRTLLIGTQVVEQSLDLDADFMVSELAPVDLILQRMGRLYRHTRARESVGPRFLMTYDIEESGLPALGSNTKVYAEYTLLRSWLALKDLPGVELPGDIETLVDAVYSATEPSPEDTLWRRCLAESAQKLNQKRADQRAHAARVSVPFPRDGMTFMDWISMHRPTLEDDDDPETHRQLLATTRDGDPSLTVVLCGTDVCGNPLSPQPVGDITPAVAQEMMAFSLPISQQDIYRELAPIKPPPNWQRNTLLRHCRRIVLNTGCQAVAGRRLTLSKERGLEIERENLPRS